MRWEREGGRERESKESKREGRERAKRARHNTQLLASNARTEGREDMGCKREPPPPFFPSTPHLYLSFPSLSPSVIQHTVCPPSIHRVFSMHFPVSLPHSTLCPFSSRGKNEWERERDRLLFMLFFAFGSLTREREREREGKKTSRPEKEVSLSQSLLSFLST